MFKRVQAFMLALSLVLTFGIVGSTTVQAAEVILAIEKINYLAGEPIELEISAVSEEWVENGAFVGSFPIDGSADDYLVFEYLEEGDNMFTFDGIIEEGAYEIRVYICDEPALEEDLFATVTITVGGSAWGAYEMVTDADEYADGIDLEITVSGVPQFMIDNYAFIGIYEMDAASDDPFDYGFISEAEDENIITLLAPYEPGIYEVRAYSMENVTSESQLVAKHEVVFLPSIDGEADDEIDDDEDTEFPETARVIHMNIGSGTMMVNGEAVEIDPGFDTTPVLTPEGRVIVPIRAVVAALGGTISWDGEKQELTMEANDNMVVMTIGQSSFVVNDEEQTMDIAPVIINGRTMIPLRAAGEALSCSVNWIGEQHEIQIIYLGE